MDNKHHIDQLFSGVFENYELKPSSDVWNRIENELENTQKTPVNIPYSRYAALLFIFVSLCFIAIPVNKKNSLAQIRNYSETPVSQEFIAAEAISPILTINSSEGISNTNKIAQVNSRPVSEENTNTINTIIASNIKSHVQTNDFIYAPAFMDHEEELTAEKIDIKDLIYNSDVSIPLFSYDYIENEGDEEYVAFQSKSVFSNLKDFDMRGMYIGVSGSYNQTSILEYGNIFKEERPIQPSLKFGTSKGFVLGYNFSNKFGIQAEYIYNSIQGQNYVMSEEGEIVQKSLSLSYDLIPVTAKIKVGRISDLTNLPVILNYSVGAQYGMLRSYRLPQDKRYETSDNVFKDDEVSLVLGLDYDIYIQDNLYLSAGARGTISNDISLHDEPLTDNAKRNFVFGLRGSLNYVFR